MTNNRRVYYDALQSLQQPTLKAYYNSLYTEFWHRGKYYHNGGLLERTRIFWIIENQSINGDTKSMEALLADWEEANRSIGKMITYADRNPFELLKPILGTLIARCQDILKKIGTYNIRVQIVSCYDQTAEARKYDGFYKPIAAEDTGWQKMRKEEADRITYDDLKQQRVAYLYYGKFVERPIESPRVTTSPQWGQIVNLLRSLATRLESYYQERENREIIAEQQELSYSQIREIYNKLARKNFIGGGMEYFFRMYIGGEADRKLVWKLRPKRNTTQKHVSVLYELLWLLGKNQKEREKIVNTYFADLSYSRFADTIEKSTHKYSAYYGEIKQIIDAARNKKRKNSEKRGINR